VSSTEQYVRADDDKPNEKFKKYDNVGQSYEDHSKVLMSTAIRNTPGTSLPLMTTKDGLLASRQVVMLPPSNYVSTIVGVIEGANLQKYDQMVMEQARREKERRLAPQTTARGMCLPLQPTKRYCKAHSQWSLFPSIETRRVHACDLTFRQPS
jgi:hypothetical protein